MASIVRIASCMLLLLSTHSTAFSLSPTRRNNNGQIPTSSLQAGPALAEPEVEESTLTEAVMETESPNPAQEDTMKETSQESRRNELPPRALAVTGQLELPFSAEVAFDAFSDLTRQPEWSPWLHSVEFLDDEDDDDESVANVENAKNEPKPKPKSSKWTLKVLGVSYSWISVATRRDRPFLIEWESVSGLKNFGSVRFTERKDGTCHMVMTMTFVPPRLVSSVFRNMGRLKRFMETIMIGSSLRSFRDIILLEESNKPGALNSTMILFPI